MISLTHLLNMANKICTFSLVQGSADQQLTRDDMFLSQKILFGVLALMTIIVSILCTSNGVLLHKNKRFKNYPLLFFYIFAVLTLLCNCFAFHHDLVRLMYLFDIVIHWGNCTYQLFKWMPSYTYVTTAYCYITNW